MLMGAFFAILGADKFDSWPIGLAIGILSGGATALLHAFFAIHLRADQIVTGTAINFLAVGSDGLSLHRRLRSAGHAERRPRHPERRT